MKMKRDFSWFISISQARVALRSPCLPFINDSGPFSALAINREKVSVRSVCVKRRGGGGDIVAGWEFTVQNSVNWLFSV